MPLDAGVPTKTHILNLLHRLLYGKPLTTPPVTAPQALRLVREPLANVERYATHLPTNPRQADFDLGFDTRADSRTYQGVLRVDYEIADAAKLPSVTNYLDRAGMRNKC